MNRASAFAVESKQVPLTVGEENEESSASHHRRLTALRGHTADAFKRKENVCGLAPVTVPGTPDAREVARQSSRDVNPSELVQSGESEGLSIRRPERMDR